MKNLQPKFISFTTETNALDYLERAGEFIDQVESNPKAWKWVILCLHSALYGFAIAACKSTDSDSVVRISKKGKRHLISLDEALAKWGWPASINASCSVNPFLDDCLSYDWFSTLESIHSATPDILRHSSIMSWFVSYQPLRGASHCRNNNRISGAAGGNPQHPFAPNQAPLRRLKPFQKSVRWYPCQFPSNPIG